MSGDPAHPTGRWLGEVFADQGHLPDDLGLDELARERPLLRALLVAGSLAHRGLPDDLIDAVETLGELRSWNETPGHPPGDAQTRPSGWPHRSPRAVLRPIAPIDLGAVHAAFNDTESSWRLPSRGRTVLPSAVEHVLEGADLQLVGAAAASPSIAVSLMALNRYDPVNQTADLTVVGLTRTAAEREFHRPPRALRFETIAMFVSHAFESMNLHKITASIPEFNWPYFADGLGWFFEAEGLLRDQVWIHGERHDVRQLAIFGDAWSAIAGEIAGAFGSVLTAPASALTAPPAGGS